MNTRVTIHDLAADSILSNNASRFDGGSVALTLSDHTQLHFRSHADMIAFGEALASMPISRPRAAA